MRFSPASIFSCTIFFVALAVFSSESKPAGPDQEASGSSPAGDTSDFPLAARAVRPFSAFIECIKKGSGPEAALEAWENARQAAGPRDIPDLMFILETPQDAAGELGATQRLAMNALAELGESDGGLQIILEQFAALRGRATPIAKVRMIEILESLDTRGSRDLIFAFSNDSDAGVQRRMLNALNLVDLPQAQTAAIGLLNSKDAVLKKEAILALGRSRSVAALPGLIELLDSNESGVKANAQWSVRNIAARSFETTVAAKSWLESERKESEDHFRALNDQLGNSVGKLAPLAVEELGKLVLMREKVEVLFAELSNHPDFRVRAAVCDALSETSPSRKTLALLTDKLKDPSDVVTASAWRALTELTQQKLPNVYDAWNKWLQKHR